MKSKCCRVCKTTKSTSELVARSDRKNSYRNICKDCHRESLREYYHNNKSSRSDYNKSWREGNQEKIKSGSKAYYLENKETILLYTKSWREGNRDKTLSYGAKRRSSKTNSCPSWLSALHKAQIDFFYTLAKDCELISGQKYHVDHIVPLQGKEVCGLHVPWNLQLLPSDINLSKHNNYNGW